MSTKLARRIYVTFDHYEDLRSFLSTNTVIYNAPYGSISSQNIYHIDAVMDEIDLSCLMLAFGDDVWVRDLHDGL